MHTLFLIRGIPLLIAVLFASGCEEPANPVSALPGGDGHEADVIREISRWKIELSGKSSDEAILEITDLRSEDGCSASLRLEFADYHIDFTEGGIDCETLSGQFSGRDSNRYLNMPSIGQIYVMDDSTLIVSGGTSLLRSTDGGRRWQQIMPGFSNMLTGWHSSNGALGTLFAIEAASTGRARFSRSSNLGETWETSLTGPSEVMRFAVHPHTGTLYAVSKSTPQALLRSTDLGEQWHTCVDLGDPYRPIQGLAFDETGRVYIVTTWFQFIEPQFAVSVDDGVHWSVQEMQLLSPLYHITGLAAAGDGLLLISASGLSAGTTQSTDGGITWTSAGFVSEYNRHVYGAGFGLIFPGGDWLINTDKGIYFKRTEQRQWEPRFLDSYHGINIRTTDRQGYVWASSSNCLYRARHDDLRFVRITNPTPSYCSLALSRDGDNLTGTLVEQMTESGPVTVWEVKGRRIK